MKLSLYLMAAVAVSMCVGPVAAQMTADDVRLDGMTITVVKTGQKLTIDPVPGVKKSVTGKLKVLKPTWRVGYRLSGTSWTFEALRRESLVVTVADRGAPLTEGADYVVNYQWGTVGAVAGGKITPTTKVRFEYDYSESRLDLIQRKPDGSLSVVKGVKDRRQPMLPKPAGGCTPVMSVYLPPNTATLTEPNLNFIDPKATGVPPVTGREYLAAVKAKLASGEPVSIVCFGDSITAQPPRNFRDKRGSFVDRLAVYLKQTYPDREVVEVRSTKIVQPTGSQIVVVKAGKGGGDTRRAMPRLAGEVLAAKPDLVVIMFGANDENRRGAGNSVPVADYQKNLVSMVSQIQAAGGAVILMTPSMKTKGWSATVGNLNEYAAAVRRVGRMKRACVVDNFKAWEDLPKIGYNYMIYLGTCINHPVDLGHELFFQGLKAALQRQ